jgi:glyoxylase-like metal-dependent hydrolase (beta-lactamase superfamily II)
MARALKIAVVAVLVLAMGFAAIMAVMMSSMKPGRGPALPQNVHQAVDGFVNAYILETGDSQAPLVMVDAGADVKGEAILAALKAMGRKPEDVAAVFLTHSHADHTAALGLFPQAQIFALQAEAGLADGSQAYHSPISRLGSGRNSKPFHLTRGLKDGETIQFGKFSISAYGIPGHTAGSAAYLASGVLFLGDAASFSKAGKMTGLIWMFSENPDQGTQSLRDLARRLKPQAKKIKFISTSHGGNAQGFEALESF